MSGQQIGTVVGGVIGAYFGGVAGAQLGMAIGGAIGGAVDPTKIQGPRLGDASQQTSQDGIPITWGYGTFPTMGNVIWQGPIVEVKSKDDGKGSGTEITNYNYLRSYAIGICEGPITGLLQIKRNGKVVYDARTDAQMTAAGLTSQQISEARAGNGKFLTKCAIYLGDEAQMPDPTIEAEEGAGNVAPNRGLAYVVVSDDDVTELGGAIPQYEFVVAVIGTVNEGTGAVIGSETATATLTGVARSAHTMANGSSLSAWIDPVYSGAGGSVGAGQGSYQYSFDSTLTVTGTSTITNAGDGPTLDGRVWSRGWGLGGWSIKADESAGHYMLHQGGMAMADLRPDSGAGSAWAFDEVNHFPEFGGMVYFTNSSVYVGVRQTDSTIYNKIFLWPLTDKGQAILLPSFSSAAVTSGSIFYLHVDSSDTPRAIAVTEAELVTYTPSLSELSRVAIPFSLTGLRAFGVDGGMLFALFGTSVKVYDLDTLALLQTVPVTGLSSSTNNQFAFTSDSIFVRSGVNISRIAYAPVCLTSAPTGWTAIPDSPGHYINDVSGEILPLCSVMHPSLETECVTLGDIVADVCQREGLEAAQYDVSQLTDQVDGYRVANEGAADAMIQPLQAAYFFDVGEWDGKLRFIKRGGASVLTLTMDDLAERDGDAIEQQRVQEAELLRRVTVGYLDPVAGYTATTQKWERRVGTVQAKGEASVEVPVVMSADDSASVAKKRGLVAWSETETFKFSLPYRRTKLTPTDVVTVTDSKAKAHRVRVMGVEEDSGVMLIEGTLDRQAVYSATALGLAPKPPTVPPSTVRGPTEFIAMNLVRLRSQDSSPGMYVAAAGVLEGWPGAVLQLSVDGGVSFGNVATMMTAAVMGTLTAPLGMSGEPLSVLVRGQLSSVTADQILARANAFAVNREVGQFQTATLGAIEGGRNNYNLTDLSRPVQGSAAASHATGDPFVLLDAAVAFLPIDVSHAGKTLVFRAVTIGTLPENNATFSVIYDPQFISAAAIDFYETELGAVIMAEDGSYLQVD